MVNGHIILHNASTAHWLSFSNPHQIITAARIDEVLPALAAVESEVQNKHLWAAGYISYEAASGFDSAFCTHPVADFPLLWFGLYPAPAEIAIPEPDYRAYTLGTPVAGISRQEYSTAINRIKDYIRKGDTYQVNYTFRMQMPFSGDPWHLFLAMVRAQSPGYAAWVDMGRHVICSASPELFFRLDSNLLTSKPMKGTVRRGRWQHEDLSFAGWLQRSEKNRAENLMIVDMIRNDLGRVADSGTVNVPQMFEVERHPTLWQMTSTVTAQCGRPLTEILQALFPCASITGAPKIRTTRIITELETTPRKIYTGSIGFIAPGRCAQFNVAIRTALIDRNFGQAEYGSGGGIVWDSGSEDEYNEALLKARVLTERRPAFSLLETLLWADGSYFLLERHLQRMTESADYFGFEVDPGRIQALLLEKASGFSKGPQRVRLLIAPDGSADIEAVPVVESPTAPVSVCLAESPVQSSDIFLYHKTTFRKVYDAARQHAPDAEDVLMWNEREELTESSISNLVVEMDGMLFTPPIESGLLAGTFRAQLLEQGIIQQKVLMKADLARGSKIYLINSVRKWREAVLIERSST